MSRMLFMVVSLQNLGTFGWKKEMFIIMEGICHAGEQREDVHHLDMLLSQLCGRMISCGLPPRIQWTIFSSPTLRQYSPTLIRREIISFIQSPLRRKLLEDRDNGLFDFYLQYLGQYPEHNRYSIRMPHIMHVSFQQGIEVLEPGYYKGEPVPKSSVEPQHYFLNTHHNALTPILAAQSVVYGFAF